MDLATPDEIVLRCDLGRPLPETGPFSRQIMMSHGTFLELLDIAARERGLKAEITLFPEGVFGPGPLDERPVARIRLAPDPTVRKDPLLAQIQGIARRCRRDRRASQPQPVRLSAVAPKVATNPAMASASQVIHVMVGSAVGDSLRGIEDLRSRAPQLPKA